MKFYIMHPDRETLNLTGIKSNDHIRLLQKDFQSIGNDNLKCGRFAVVAPGNSFGIMDGGFDLEILKRFGTGVQAEVQAKIAEEYFGELPVGCAVTARLIPLIVYAPTMQVPMNINGTANVFYATQAAIRMAKRWECDNMLFPLMGAGAGMMDLADVGEQMTAAIEFSLYTPTKIDWDYAINRHTTWHQLVHLPE